MLLKNGLPLCGFGIDSLVRNGYSSAYEAESSMHRLVDDGRKLEQKTGRRLTIEDAPQRVYATVAKPLRFYAFSMQGSRQRGGAALKPSSGHPCVNRLMGKKCDGLQEGCRPPGTDHAVLWMSGKTPMAFVSEPYGLDSEELSALVKFCEERDLLLRISAKWAWHFPSATLAVIITRKDRDLPLAGL